MIVFGDVSVKKNSVTIENKDISDFQATKLRKKTLFATLMCYS